MSHKDKPPEHPQKVQEPEGNVPIPKIVDRPPTSLSSAGAARELGMSPAEFRRLVRDPYER